MYVFYLLVSAEYQQRFSSLIVIRILYEFRILDNLRIGNRPEVLGFPEDMFAHINGLA